MPAQFFARLFILYFALCTTRPSRRILYPRSDTFTIKVMSAQSKASYGSRRESESGVSGKFIVIGAVLLLIVAGVFIYNQWRNSTSADVSGTITGFSDNTDNSIRMTIDISRDDSSKPAYCIVTALNYNKDEVGRREVVLAADGTSIGRLNVKVPTREQAVATDVYGCSSIFPSYLDADTSTED